MKSIMKLREEGVSPPPKLAMSVLERLYCDTAQYEEKTDSLQDVWCAYVHALYV